MRSGRAGLSAAMLVLASGCTNDRGTVLGPAIFGHARAEGPCVAFGAAKPAPHYEQCQRTATGEYRFGVPGQLENYPDVLAKVNRVDAELVAGMDMIAEGDRNDAKAARIAFRPWRVWLDWQVIGLNDDLASLIGTVTRAPRTGDTSVTPDRTAIAILVDRRTGNFVTDAADAFTDQMAEIHSAYCAQLDIERLARTHDANPQGGSHGAPPAFDAGGRYLGKWQCPYIGELAIGFAGTGAFDRIVFLASPGTAGPEAEGFYRVELPMSATSLAQVRTDYRAGFRAAATAPTSQERPIP